MSLGKAVRSLVRPARVVLRPSASSRSYAAVAEARAVLEGELDGIRAAGTWKAERIITSKQGPQINVDGSQSSEWCRVTVTGNTNRWWQGDPRFLKRTTEYCVCQLALCCDVICGLNLTYTLTKVKYMFQAHAKQVRTVLHWI